jgi:hypothetical protein
MGFLLSVLFFFFILYLVAKLFFKLLPFLLFRKNPTYRRNQHENEDNFTSSSDENTKAKEPIVINQSDIIDAEFEDIEEDDDKESPDG